MVQLRLLLALAAAPLLAANAEYINDDDVRGTVKAEDALTSDVAFYDNEVTSDLAPYQDSYLPEDTLTPEVSVYEEVASSLAEEPTEAPYEPYTEERSYETENRAATAGVPDWIGPTVAKPTSKACYRKTIRSKTCPPGYDLDKTGVTCWVQCPLEYPVECGMECLPQNSDCTTAIMSKVTSVATAALNAASSGVFGQIAKASQGVKIAFKCGQGLLDTSNKIQAYITELQTSKKVGTKTDEILFALSKSDFMTSDLPALVATCLNKPIPAEVGKADDIAQIVKKIAEKILDAKAKGKNLMDPKTFLDFISDVGLGPAMPNIKTTDVSAMQASVTKGMSCGGAVNAVVKRVVSMVKELKKKQPSATVEALKITVYSSDLILKDLPNAVQGCFKANIPDAFKRRDEVLKGIHVVIDGVIDTASKAGKPLTVADYTLAVAKYGLDVLVTYDPTGLINMVKDFVQPICGPSAMLGAVDDGPADKALGMRLMEKAFMSSTGAWKKVGDGKVAITFKSVDTLDVDVIIHSGGKKLANVKVPKGKTVPWSAALTAVGGKTLYIDRWRAGFLGVPGTGGGSLLLWVPKDPKGGLKLDVTINPTSFKGRALAANGTVEANTTAIVA
ncbi:hypothetical protein Poli38472_011643 [Pythium oligandrum]|uniref:Uncharacterized protein n=1 Tax=Pythium oligandrum TaxID=41045 RepID=A0A8K1CLY8_PYTOL|nr:hypothetical protein Poli38472_011643 [Pythium oligandrum]|eukprot:TMW64763.1 hypothetical protein Poli38472_011643 [Pythium oligandrum]